MAKVLQRVEKAEQTGQASKEYRKGAIAVGQTREFPGPEVVVDLAGGILTERALGSQALVRAVIANTEVHITIIDRSRRSWLVVSRR